MYPIVIGDLVYFTHNNSTTLSCQCVFCNNKSTCLGIVTESWIDIDDEQSLIIDFDFGQWTFRLDHQKYLKIIAKMY
jgi:hypothetical protein